jgi:3-oxoacyl-[acyl-carrier-protein] synthase III
VEPGLGFVGRVQLLRGDLHDGVVITRTSGDTPWYAGGTVAPMAVTSRDRDAAREMGAQGPEFAAEACGLLLERHGCTPSEVDFFVCAQATAWFGEACARAVGVGEGRYTGPGDHFQKYGHLLAGSAPLNLWVAWSTGRLRKGDLVLVYSPGVGFVQGATLIRWAMEPPALTPRA